MAVLVLILGAVIACGGAVVLISPTTPQGVARQFLESGHLYFAAVIRLVLGVVLVIAAPYCRPEEPWVGTAIRVIGVLTILIGAGLLVIGRRRLQAMIEWALRLPPSVLRMFAPIALVLGGFLIYAGL